MRKTVLVAVLATVLASFASDAAAIGDRCEDAIDILPGITSGNLAVAHSQWFRFEATRSGDLPVNTSLPGTTFETTVAAYSACGRARIAYDVGTFPGRKANVSLPVVAGRTYYIEVGRLAGGSGPFELGIDTEPLGACAPGAGDCFTDTGSPGCDDSCGGLPCLGCCELICAGDDFCCAVQWDEVCADHATGVTSPPGPCGVEIFADGFESGDFSAWSQSVPWQTP